jgi:hypothetical protein
LTIAEKVLILSTAFSIRLANGDQKIILQSTSSNEKRDTHMRRSLNVSYPVCFHTLKYTRKSNNMNTEQAEETLPIFA